MSAGLRRSRAAHAIVVVLLGTVLAGALVPCPPAPGALDPMARAEVAQPAAPDPDTVARQVAANDGWCRSAPRAVLVARCACGCGERPAALGSPVGLGVAMVSRVSLALSPPIAVGAVAGPAASAPCAPLLAIDHVPRPA
jgi:hypothetical protein